MRKALTFGALVLIGLFSGCSPDLSDDPIPFVPFSAININLNLPEYQSLRQNGYGYIQGGVRGIILYRLSADQYKAYERNCSYQPNQACATVEIHTSGLYMHDPCCGSTFSLESGDPTGAPAWRPLREYETYTSGSQLTITDKIVD